MGIIVVSVYLHLYLSVNIEVDVTWLLPPVVWSFVESVEVLGDLIIFLSLSSND
jgi:hypothetical protein